MAQNIKEKTYLATTGKYAVRLAGEHGLGLELDHICQSLWLDGDKKPKIESKMRKDIEKAGASRLVLHAPFTELFPAAIDPKARELAADRFGAALSMSKDFGINRVVVHSGYLPRVYFKSYHEEKSVEFWTELLAGYPDDMMIMIENVLEDEPYMMRSMLEKLDAAEKERGGKHRYGICLDVGHAAVAGDVPVAEWVDVLGKYIVHTHLHNNNGEGDFHDVFDCEGGVLDMEKVLDDLISKGADDMTFTIEALEPEPCIVWMKQRGYI